MQLLLGYDDDYGSFTLEPSNVKAVLGRKNSKSRRNGAQKMAVLGENGGRNLRFWSRNSTRILSLCLSTLTTLSTHFSATNIPTPTVFASLPIQNSLYLLPLAPKYLHELPLHRISCTYAISIRLSPNACTNSPDLPVSQHSRYQPERASLSAVHQPWKGPRIHSLLP